MVKKDYTATDTVILTEQSNHLIRYLIIEIW